MVEPGVSLERFAELRAEMDGGSRRDDVLAREKLGPEAWIEAQRVWLDRMGTEIEHGRFELTNRYSKAFVARQAAIATASAPVASPDRSPVASPAPRSPSSPAPALAPSFLAAPELAPPAQIAPLVAHALPEEVAPVTSPLPPPHQSASDFGKTSFGASAPFGSSLPFAPPSVQKTLPASEPPPRAAPPLTAKERFGTTAASSSGAAALPATPFESNGPFGFTMERYAALSAELELGGDTVEVLRRHGIDRDQKTKVDAHYQQRFTVDPLASLNFMRLVAKETARIKAKPGSGPPPRRPSQPEIAPPAAAKKPAFGSTAFLSVDALPRAALPFQPKPATPPAEARSPELTLQQYASLCAELTAAATPAATTAILAKYRVAEPGARLALDAAWAAAFAKTPATRAEFERLTAEYRAWLLRRP